MEPGSEDQKKEAAQKLMPHVKDILAFTAVMIKSANKRQEILTEMLKLNTVSADTPQKALEDKLTALSSLARKCITEKGKFVSALAQGPNPFDENLGNYIVELSEPDVWDYFSKDIPLNPRNESTHWNELCTLCKQEADKVNRLLVAILDSNK